MITDSARDDLYELLKSRASNPNKRSNILPHPSKTSAGTTDYIISIKTMITSATIIIQDVLIYKDLKIVYGSYNTKANGFFAIFDLDNKLINIFKEIDNYNGAGKIPFGYIKIMEVDRNGLLYGLIETNGKVNLFRISDILESIGVLDIKDIDLFYTAHVDIETVDNTDPKNILGYAGAKTYEHISIENDFVDTEKYGFIFWNKTDTKVRFIQVIVPLGSKTKQELTWEYNEDIIIGSGTGATSFSNISNLALSTGDKNILVNGVSGVSKGSIIIQTSSSSGGSTLIHRSKDVVNTAVTRENKKGEHYFTVPYHELSGDFTVKIDLSQEIRQLIAFYSGLPTRNEKETISISLKSFAGYQTSNTNIILDENTSRIIKNNADLHLVITSIIVNKKTNIQKMEIYSGTNLLQTVKVNFFSYHIVATFLPTFGYDTQAVIYDIRPEISINASYDIEQVSSVKAQTQMIQIININNDTSFEVKQVENNIYKGTKAVFLNPNKAFVPLLNRRDGSFSIWEFDSEKNNSVEINKFYNDIAPDNQPDNSDYKIDLIDPIRIISVLIDSVSIPNTRYSLINNKIVINNVSKQQTIDITYKTLVGTPKKIILSGGSTNGDDIFITGVNNSGELNVTNFNQSIVGVGDDNGKVLLGFTLYANTPNVDQNSITENVSYLGNNYVRKLLHVTATRQNNILFIFGYNNDFSKEVRYVSIYPESFKPYTFYPYDDKKQEFHLERLNLGLTEELKSSKFDNEFSNIANSGTTLIASTNAKSTDFNYNGEAILSIYGHTNKLLFSKKVPYKKTKQQTQNINFSIDTIVLDRTDPLVPIERPKAAVPLSKIFNTKFSGQESDIVVKLRIYYDDGSFTDHSLISLLEIEGGVLRLKATITKGAKKIVKLQLLNSLDNLLGEVIPCDDDKGINITWDLRISDKKDRPIAKWDSAIWDKDKYHI